MKKLTFVKKLIDKYGDDDTATLAASLSFYTALSVAPILILFVAICSKLNFSVTQKFLKLSQDTLGTEAAMTVQNIMQHSQQKTDLASLASWVSIIALILSASLVFSHIQMALNRIFKEKNACENKLSGRALLVCLFFKQKVFYAATVLGFIALLIASLTVSSLIFDFLQNDNAFLAILTNIISSLLVFTFIFTFMYRYIPQSKQVWKFSFYGGLLTAVFFVLGTQLISIYISHSEIGLAFGASGSLLLFLVWVYYSALIILLGAQVSFLLMDFHSKGKLT